MNDYLVCGLCDKSIERERGYCARINNPSCVFFVAIKAAVFDVPDRETIKIDYTLLSEIPKVEPLPEGWTPPLHTRSRLLP